MLFSKLFYKIMLRLCTKLFVNNLEEFHQLKIKNSMYWKKFVIQMV